MPSAPPQAPPTQAQQELVRMEALHAKQYQACNEMGQRMLDRAVFGAWLEVKRERCLRAARKDVE